MMNEVKAGRGIVRAALDQAAGLAGLMASRYRSPEALRRLQAARLRRLAAGAVRDVPFHRNRWREAKLRPEDIRSIDDLAAVPFMFRGDLQRRPETDIVSASAIRSRCRVFATSGTSGRPLTVLYHPEDETVFNLTWIRAYLVSGLRPWHRLAAFQGEGRGMLEARRRWYSRLGWWRRAVVSTWDPPETWLRTFGTFRPQAAVTDAGTWRILAEAARSSGRSDLALRLLFNVSVLIEPATRSLLASVFGGPVIDLYGSFESGCLAWECPVCRGYHLNSDTAVVEILKDGRAAGPGEEGEVFVTNLFSSAMPIIRYGLGDLAVKSDRKPVCGWPFPLLDRLGGRRDDILRLAGGRTIGPQPFHHIFSPHRSVHGWRVIQTAPERVSVAVQPGPGFGGEERAALAADILDLFGPDIEVEWEFPAFLPYDPGGKMRSVINRSNVLGGAA